MKRPGWLGGKGDAEDEPDAEDGTDEDSGAEPGDDERSGTAAERSARRIAARRERAGSPDVRRSLADRVGRASGGAKPKADEAERDDAEEPDEKPKPKEAAKPKPKAVAKAETVRKPKPVERPKAQTDEERKAERKPEPDADAESEADGKSMSKSDPKAKAKAGAKSKPGGKSRAKDLNRPRRQRGDEGREGKTTAGKDARAGRRREKDAKRTGGDGRAARRRRDADKPSAGARAKTAGAGFAKALKRGGSETRKWAATNGPKAGRGILASLGAVFAIFFEVIGFVLNVLIAIWRLVSGPVTAVLRVLDRAVRAASRALTPVRALALVVAGAAILLALSQYADYRTISIGNDAYSGVQTLAPAPETGRLQTGDAHSYVFVPIAVACLLLLGAAVFGGRWRLCRLIALAGAAAIVVAIVVDRPEGLDPGDAAVSFEGVKATLIGGFYAQIAAGALLIGSSSLLARELRLAGSTKRAGEPRRRRSETRKLRGQAPDARGARA